MGLGSLSESLGQKQFSSLFSPVFSFLIPQKKNNKYNIFASDKHL